VFPVSYSKLKFKQMKKIFLILSVFGFAILLSCDNEKSKDESSETVATDQNVMQSEVTATDSVQQPAAQAQEVTVSQPTVNVAPPSTGVASSGMNPAHGQPGHRCDIAVGAPLNSPPGNPTTITSPGTGPQNPSMTPVVSNPPVNQVAPQTMKAPSGPTPAGMNPPHGEPGHDCSVAVGAPLKK
jgi:hypothetical protein